MAQANSADSTIATTGSGRRRLVDDAKLAQAYRNMESAISDLRLMAALASGAIEDALGGPTIPELKLPKNCIYLPEAQCETTIFSVYHLQDMVNALYRQWRAQLDETKGPETADA